MRISFHLFALVALIAISVACSAEEILPLEVQNTFEEIQGAANKNDFDRLQKIIDKNPGGVFKYTLGPGEEATPTEFWKKEQDVEGKDFFKQLLAILETEPAVDGDYYVWPGFFTKPAKELSQNEVDAWIALDGKDSYDDAVKADMGYIGMRLAISKDGFWTYYIGGD